MPTKNVPIWINILVEPIASVIVNESKARLKRDRPLGSKDKNPTKKKSSRWTMIEPHTKVQDMSNFDIF